jgi:DNA polymerase-4
MDYYASVSRQIREIYYHFTPVVEPLALDEAFLDATGSQRIFGSSVVIARKIKNTIYDKLDLVASVGVAPNKFVAKIASDVEKPDGFVVVEPGQVQEFLDPLPIERMWGVGRAGSRSFHHMEVHTFGQLRQLPLETLQGRFGKQGRQFWRLARGIDDRHVQPDREAKSISHETTFETDIEDPEILRAWLLELTDQVARRVRRHRLRARTVQVKIRFADFQTITRDRTLAEPTDSTDKLWEAASAVLAERVPQRHPSVRLLGMGVSGLVGRQHATQRLLFDQAEEERGMQLDQLGDQVKQRYGPDSLRRAAGLYRPKREER